MVLRGGQGLTPRIWLISSSASCKGVMSSLNLDDATWHQGTGS